MKKMFSRVLALIIACGFIPVIPISTVAADAGGGNDSGIDYSAEDVIVPGSENGFSINLTKETITTGYAVKALSADGGATWRPVRNKLDAGRLSYLFNPNRDLILHLSDTEINKKMKKPNYKVVKNVIKVKDGTVAAINGVIQPGTDAREINVKGIAGTVELWMSATARRPASAKQMLTFSGEDLQ